MITARDSERTSFALTHFQHAHRLGTFMSASPVLTPQERAFENFRTYCILQAAHRLVPNADEETKR